MRRAPVCCHQRFRAPDLVPGQLSQRLLRGVMTKSHAVAVTQLREAHVLLTAQAKEIASLRASTLLHVERIAEMQAELDVRPGTRAPRSAGIAAVTLSRASADRAVRESELNG